MNIIFSDVLEKETEKREYRAISLKETQLKLQIGVRFAVL